MTLFEAFETPIGARETDRTWRGMVARARHDYLARLMPIWAGVLTLATLIFGIPGLYLLGRSTTLSGNPSIETALASGPLAGSLALIGGWLQPLAETLSPTQNRFSLEAFLVGLVLTLAVAWIIRAAGSRQWFQSVYDDIPRRRLILTWVLWLALPVLVAFLLLFFGALADATADSPRVVGILVAVVALVVMTLCLSVVYLTFSVREPAIPSVLVGAFFASLGMLLGYWVLSIIPGIGSALGGETAPLRAILTLSAFLFVFWSIVLAGSQLAVSLARRRDPIERFQNASRGEQLDFALSLIRDVEDQTRSRRWAQTAELAKTLAAPTAMVTFALDRLRRSGIVEYAADGSRPPARWAIKDDLESLTLNDLSRAMGTSLDPNPGLHGRAAEDVIAELAEREHLSQSQNLLSLFRDAPDLPPVGEPMLAVADAAYGFDDVDGFAPSGGFQPIAQVVDRSQGDNGGPVEGEDESFVFVDGTVKDDVVLDMHAGPSALLEQDNGDDDEAAALDLTDAMRIVPRFAEDLETETPEDGPLMVSALADEDIDDDALGVEEPAALPLGDDSPLAAVRGEIDNLIDHSADVPVAPAVAALAPMARWRGDDDGAEEAAEEAIEALPEPVPFVAAPDPEYVDPVASWRGGRVPARNPQWDEVTAPTSSLADETAEPDPLPDTLFQPLPAKRSWRREAATPVPAQSWKQGGPGAERLYVPIAPQPATIEPSHRFDFGSK